MFMEFVVFGFVIGNVFVVKLLIYILLMVLKVMEYLVEVGFFDGLVNILFGEGVFGLWLVLYLGIYVIGFIGLLVIGVKI